MKKVNINIWDDFYDDGYVPAGKTQQTYAYVEEREEDFSEDLQDEIMKFFFEQIKSSKHLEGVTVKYQGRINFDNITHKKLWGLMKELEGKRITYKTSEGEELEFSIYSES